MKAHLIKFGSEKELAQAALRLGASEASLRFFEARRETLQIYVTDVPSPAASIIKQEMLSRGGDAAVHANVINCGVERSDVIIFGTAKQLGHLADKLELMPWWKLSELAAEIRRLTAPRAKRAVKLPCGAELAFGERMLLMGIINLTDDSFFGGSRCYGDADKAAAKAVKMAEDGADILDLGAESTRPGAPRVPEEQERERMSAAVAAIRRELPHMPLSIDTTRASVAEAALENGADIVNDVSGLQFDNGIAEAAARHKAMLVLMHMRGTPETMRTMCGYDNLLSEVCKFLEEAADKAVSYYNRPGNRLREGSRAEPVPAATLRELQGARLPAAHRRVAQGLRRRGDGTRSAGGTAVRHARRDRALLPAGRRHNKGSRRARKQRRDKNDGSDTRSGICLIKEFFLRLAPISETGWSI